MSKRNKSTKHHIHQSQSMTSVASALPLHVLAAVTLIVVSAFFAYFPSLSGGFIFDDEVLLTNNELIKAHDGLYRFWCTTEALEYYPITNTMLWIEWRLWGTNSTGYHVINLVLHIAEALLIWIILRKLSIPGAFLAAMIFALHPVNVESVAWISQRRNVMAMLFFLLSILCYLKMEIQSPSAQNGLYRIASFLALRPSPLLWYWLSLMAFILAMLSKGSVAVLPALLLGIVWWLRPLTKRDLLLTTPFIVVATVLTVLNMWFQTHGAAVDMPNIGFIERLLGAGGVVWFYLYKALLPIDLAFVYPQWHIKAGHPLWWVPLLAALVVTAVLWRYRESWSRPFLFAWGFFCVALLPVMGFTIVGFMRYSLVADHYQHIAIIGVIVLVTAGWGIWDQRVRGAVNWAATVIAVAAVGALAFLTWQQSGLYHEEITLYHDTLEKNPNCSMAHNNLGKAMVQAGRFQEASEQFLQALQLKPDSPEFLYNLGITLANVGRLQEAIQHYQQALRLKPNYPEAHNNLGIVLVSKGRFQEAIEHYQQALRLKTNYFEAYNNLGVVLVQTGRPQQAIKYYQQALRLKPDYFEALNNIGAALDHTGQTQEAIEHYQQALHLKPDSTTVYYNLALVYAKMQQSSQAVAAAQKALEIARSQKQIELAKQIEDWLNTYRASQSPSNR